MEKYISIPYNKDNLLGVVHECGDENAPIALFLHGIPGDRVDTRRLPVRIARNLCKHGINSVRVDLYASGISLGEYSMVSLSDQLEQLKRIILFIRNDLKFNGLLNLIAFSESAKIALKLMQETKSINSICFCNGILFKERTVDSLKIKKLYKRFNQYVGNIGFGVWLNAKVFDEIAKYSIDDSVKLPMDKLMFIYGDSDLMTQESRCVLEKRAKYIQIIHGADHLFTHSQYDAQIIQYVYNWLKYINRLQD